MSRASMVGRSLVIWANRKAVGFAHGLRGVGAAGMVRLLGLAYAASLRCKAAKARCLGPVKAPAAPVSSIARRRWVAFAGPGCGHTSPGTPIWGQSVTIR